MHETKKSIEQEAITFFQDKYPSLDFTVDADKEEVDWWDWVESVNPKPLPHSPLLLPYSRPQYP